MKKTIAILLVLVIGMVGVFAGAYDASETINLTTDVLPVSSLFITTAQYDEYTDYDTASTDEAELDIIVNASGVIEGVGYLTIFSNLRSGYAIGYEVTALTSGTGENARYINYSVQIGSDALTLVTTNDATTDSATIKSVGSQTLVEVFSEEIKITIDDDFNTAVAGDDYAGTIVFTYTAG